MEEVWKDINGYEGLFQISNLGRVKRLEKSFIDSIGRKYNYKEKIYKLQKDNNGYLLVTLPKSKLFRVHRLVANAFLENPNNLKEINHIDGNKSNANVLNLEWVTHKENMKHALESGLMDNARKVFSKKATERKLWKLSTHNKVKVNMYDKNNNFIKSFNSLVDASKYIKVAQQRIWQVCNGVRKSAKGYVFRYI